MDSLSAPSTCVFEKDLKLFALCLVVAGFFFHLITSDFYFATPAIVVEKC